MAEFSENLKKLVGVVTEEEAAQKSHAELYLAREKGTKEESDTLAPLEHRAFAREVTQENPWMAIPVGLATPLYEAAKATGILEVLGQADEKTSKASFKAITEAYKGIYEGLTSDSSKKTK